MRYEPCRIPAGEIDFHDRCCSLLPAGVEDSPPDTLIASIQRFGVLQPPLLLPRGPERYAVVSGWRRLAALAGREPAIWCRVLPADTPIATALLLAYEENRFQRGDPPLHRAVLVARLADLLDWQELCRTVLPGLGLAARRSTVERLQRLVRMEQPVLQALHDGRLDAKAAEELTGLPMRDRLVLHDCIVRLRLSVANQRKLVAGCSELSRRHATTVATLLAGEEPRAILNHPAATPGQKAAKLMRWLERRRFPRLSAAEKAFAEWQQGLDLPPAVRVRHAPAFERDQVTVEITVPDTAAAERLLAAARPLLTAPGSRPT